MSGAVRELTPRGRGGVTVLEVIGGEARQRLEQLAGRLPSIGRFGLVRLVLADDADRAGSEPEILDEAIVLRRGSDHCEVHLTGSPTVARRAAALLAGDAVPLEDARSIETRAWLALANAPCEAAARVLLDQSRGALRLAIEGHLADSPEAWRSFMAGLIENARVAEPLLRPVDVVLAGPTNAGKSTLFNVLVGRERVTVGEEPGTTRDAVAADALLGAWPVKLVDTAGEREAPSGELGSLERLGQERARDRRRRAALSIWLDPADAPGRSEPGGGRWVRIASRADLATGSAGSPSISALRDPVGARETIAKAFRESLELPEDPWRAASPVPFEADLVRALAGLARVDGRGPRSEVLQAIMGPYTDPTRAGFLPATRVVGRSALG